MVNEGKTEICLFHTNDPPQITISLQGAQVISKKSMNVLGVTFDSKLNWSIQVANSISKANKALFALRLIKKFFTKKEMRTILDSNFYLGTVIRRRKMKHFVLDRCFVFRSNKTKCLLIKQKYHTLTFSNQSLPCLFRIP